MRIMLPLLVFTLVVIVCMASSIVPECRKKGGIVVQQPFSAVCVQAAWAACMDEATTMCVKVDGDPTIPDRIVGAKCIEAIRGL